MGEKKISPFGFRIIKWTVLEKVTIMPEFLTNHEEHEIHEAEEYLCYVITLRALRVLRGENQTHCECIKIER